jgi:hypothetical protein
VQYRSKLTVDAVEYNGRNLNSIEMFLTEFAPSLAHFLDSDPALWVASRGQWVSLARTDVVIHSERYGLDVLSNNLFLHEYEPVVA